MDKLTAYKILGLDESSGEREIKLAYARLSKTKSFSISPKFVSAGSPTRRIYQETNLLKHSANVTTVAAQTEQSLYAVQTNGHTYTIMA